jgi:hypothetical protein
MEKLWKEGIAAQFEVLSKQKPGGSNENHDTKNL